MIVAMRDGSLRCVLAEVFSGVRWDFEVFSPNDEEGNCSGLDDQEHKRNNYEDDIGEGINRDCICEEEQQLRQHSDDEEEALLFEWACVGSFELAEPVIQKPIRSLHLHMLASVPKAWQGAGEGQRETTKTLKPTGSGFPPVLMARE